MAATNPFNPGKLVTGKDFCGRSELEDLHDYLKAGHVVAMYGERRIGKTSLVQESVRTLRGYKMLYIDIFEIESLMSLCERISSAILRATGDSHRHQLFKLLRRLRPKISMGLKGPSFSFDVKKDEVELTKDFEPLLDYLLKEFSAQKYIVVMDEFQSISNLPQSRKVQASIRSRVQEADNAFVFLGSIAHDMHQLFKVEGMPMKGLAKVILLGYLKWPDFMAFLSRKFIKTKYKVDADVWPAIRQATRGQPYYTQLLCSELWMTHRKTRTITPESMQLAYDSILDENKQQYKYNWSGLRDTAAKGVLRALAKQGGKSTGTVKFRQAANLADTSRVEQSLAKLCKLGLVLQDGKEYYYADPFFRIWLLQNGY